MILKLEATRLVILLSLLGAWAFLVPGCIAPGARLTFPPPVDRSTARWTFDVDGNSRIDFTVSAGPGGRLDALSYDDDEDGSADRVYRLSEYSADEVPHLIVLLDSIPFHSALEKFTSRGWSWFDRPEKVIPPFPTMSGVIFTDIMRAPPLPGMINKYYDRSKGETSNLIWDRVWGHVPPWQQRLHYKCGYDENGMAFLRPREWFGVEMARVKSALDRSPDKTTVVYTASTSGLVSRYGAQGVDETLDLVETLSLQLMYERQGAIKITVMADHGHNLMASKRVEFDDTLSAAGFRVATRLRTERDVVMDIDGMVNYMGMHTRRPAPVADALLHRPEVQLAMYLEGERVIVRNSVGAAAIEGRGERYKYSVINTDVLGLVPIAEALAAGGKADPDGFIDGRDWFNATVDHEWPDAPYRLWRAFHGLVVHTPDLMLTLHDGYSTGIGWFEYFITMASTHGGLNQVNSSTFVMTMNGRVTGPLRSGEVLDAIAPGFTPRVREK